MTRGLEEALGLPHLDDLLKSEGIETKKPANNGEVDQEQFAKTMEMAEQKLAMIEGKDHADAMDEIFKDALKHAKDIADLGFNIDIARAPRMFEVAANMYTVALNAKNSKRDAQLKAMKLALDQKNLELKERAMKGDSQASGAVEAEATVIADRNELIKQLREQAKAGK